MGAWLQGATGGCEAHEHEVLLLLLEESGLGHGLDEAELVHEDSLRGLARLHSAHEGRVVALERRQDLRGAVPRAAALVDHLQALAIEQMTQIPGISAYKEQI